MTAFGLAPGGVPVDNPGVAAMLAWSRRADNAFFAAAPTTAPAQNGAGSVVVRGALGALSQTGDTLAYTVVQQPADGTVTIGADGHWTYTPNGSLAAAGGTDAFTVKVADTGFHINLLGLPTATSVPVSVTVTPITSLAVGADPQGVTVSSDGSHLYVTHLDGSVSAVDTTDHSITSLVAASGPATGAPGAGGGAGAHAEGVAQSPDGTKLYVANPAANSVSVIDLTGAAPTRTISVGKAPSAIAVSHDGAHAYVVNGNDSSVSVIDTASGTSSTIAVGVDPSAITLSHDGAHAYVSNFSDGTVSVIDTAKDTVVNTIDVGGHPSALALRPDDALLYVSDYSNGTVSVRDALNGGESIATIAVGANPSALALSPDDARLLVSNAGNNTVSVIDTSTNKVATTVAVGNTPDAITFNPTGTTAYVANTNSGSVSAIALAPDPLPGAYESFTVYNLTPQPLYLLRYKDGKSADNVPVYTKIEMGQSLTFAKEYRGSATVQPEFSWGPYVNDPLYEVKVELGTRASTKEPYVHSMSCKNDGRGCTTNTTAGTVSLLHFKNTIELGPGQGQEQALVLRKLCDADSAAKCSFTPTKQIDTFGNPHPVGNAVRNESYWQHSYSVAIQDSQSQSDSISLSVKAGGKLADLINVEISATYGHTWTATHTFTQTIMVNVPGYHTGQVVAEQPVYRVYGDFTIKMGNTTWVLKDVYFDTPKNSGGGVYTIRVTPNNGIPTSPSDPIPTLLNLSAAATETRKPATVQ